jgi:hypothetical protein
MEDEALTPKKYIRTLERDMEILKSGGKPDLAPLAEPRPNPEERLVAASPMPAQIPIPPPPPVPEPLPKESPIPELAKPTPIETYASDFSDQIKKENASPITVLAAEQDSKKPEIKMPPARHSSGILYTVFGFILIIAGGVGIYIAYTHYSESLAPIILAPTISAPITVDEREQISGTGTVLLQAIEESVMKQLAPNTIRLLYTTSATTTGDSVFSALQEPAPDILLRNINANGSMAGIINSNGVQSPFFILSVASYSGTFSGMLSWESSMPNDLEKLFPAYINPTTVSMATTTATTTAKTITKITASSTIPKMLAGFRDEVVDNHDVRMYSDTAGRSIILYGYWNQATLVIARDPDAFTEILDRLAASQAGQ